MEWIIIVSVFYILSLSLLYTTTSCFIIWFLMNTLSHLLTEVTFNTYKNNYKPWMKMCYFISMVKLYDHNVSLILICILTFLMVLQVILYKLSTDMIVSEKEGSPEEQMVKWIYIGYVRAHTHDIRALTIAVPISREGLATWISNDIIPFIICSFFWTLYLNILNLPDCDLFIDILPREKAPKAQRREKSISFSYLRWAHLGVPMLISGGDDSKLFAYPAKEFTQFSPHDICPAPQRPLIKFANNTSSLGASKMLVEYSCWLDVLEAKLDGKKVVTQLLARVKSKGSRNIICSSISNSGLLLAYSDQQRPYLFEFKKQKNGRNKWSIDKIQLPKGLPYAHSVIFSADSSCLMLAGHDRKIYVSFFLSTGFLV